jgi:hypothetical protein
MKICPKCGYERTQKDDAFISVGECPKCGVIYEKEKAHSTQQEKRAEDDRLQQVRSQVNIILQRVDAGQETYIYDSVYVPVDCIVDKKQSVSSFDISINGFGWMGYCLCCSPHSGYGWKCNWSERNSKKIAYP